MVIVVYILYRGYLEEGEGDAQLQRNGFVSRWLVDRSCASRVRFVVMFERLGIVTDGWAALLSLLQDIHEMRCSNADERGICYWELIGAYREKGLTWHSSL